MHIARRLRATGTLTFRAVADRLTVLLAWLRSTPARAVATYASVSAAVVLSVLALLNQLVPTVSTTLAPPYRVSGTYGFVAPIPPPFGRLSLLQAPSDSITVNDWSTLVLFEDGEPMGPAHSLHSAIREVGEGRYSHWGHSLVFSTTDNSDPTTNGSSYSIRFRPKVRRSYLLAAATALMGSCFWLACLTIPKGVIMIAGVVGLAGLCLNTYGALVDLDLPNRFLSRPDDTVWSYADAIDHIRKARRAFEDKSIDDDEFVLEMMRSVNYRMTNIHWKYLASDEALRVPLTTNWILWLYGAYPEYKDYDFADAYRSLERGLGMCGAQSETVARLLGENGFESGIFASDTHTVAWATSDAGSWIIDPDYGVLLIGSLEDVQGNQEALVDSYSNMLQAGYDATWRQQLLRHYSPDAGGTGMHSIEALEDGERESALYLSGNKRTFEDWAYIVKWLVPAALVLSSVIFWLARARRRPAS